MKDRPLAWYLGYAVGAILLATFLLVLAAGVKIVAGWAVGVLL